MRNCSKNLLLKHMISVVSARYLAEFLWRVYVNSFYQIRNQIFKSVVPRDAEGHPAIKNTLDFCEFTGKFINLKK